MTPAAAMAAGMAATAMAMDKKVPMVIRMAFSRSLSQLPFFLLLESTGRVSYLVASTLSGELRHQVHPGLNYISFDFYQVVFLEMVEVPVQSPFGNVPIQAGQGT